MGSPDNLVGDVAGDEDGEEAEEGGLLWNPWPPESRGGLSRMSLPAFTDS